jgi:hypothetical protein
MWLSFGISFIVITSYDVTRLQIFSFVNIFKKIRFPSSLQPGLILAEIRVIFGTRAMPKQDSSVFGLNFWPTPSDKDSIFRRPRA